AAHDLSLNREVAIKITHPQITARDFWREVWLMSRLPHPGIPAVHSAGELADGRLYLVMKLVRGKTLEALLRDRATPESGWGPLLAIFERVCQAVGYAHSQGIVHRDLKPANIMVGAFGEVQVMDWGLAEQLPSPAGASPVTPTGPATPPAECVS
ncbi:MAG: serine/threonine-protein kinase, partial [Planctomycetaceae bacterium]